MFDGMQTPRLMALKIGIGDVGMNSFNHYAYGCVVGWIFEHAAGISPGDEPGYEKFKLAPNPDRRAKSLKATYRTDKGEIVSDWRYDGERCIWRFTIPKGTQAEVTVPGRAPRTMGPGSYVERF